MLQLHLCITALKIWAAKDATSAKMAALKCRKVSVPRSRTAKVTQRLSSWLSSSFERQKATANWCLPMVSCHSCILLAGMPFTSGLRSRSEVVASVDAPPLTLLKKAGAIPLVTTNTSELCMWFESHNHLHGVTKNPYDLERIPGGSSGQLRLESVVLLPLEEDPSSLVVFYVVSQDTSPWCSSFLSSVHLRRGRQFIGGGGLSHRGRFRHRREHSHTGFLHWDIWT